MNAAGGTFAQRRLLELLGIERYVARDAAATPAPVGGTSAPMRFAKGIGAEAPPTVTPAPLAVAVDCSPGDADRYAGFIRHLARAIGVDPDAFARRTEAAHTICFGTTPPDGPVTLAPPLAALRQSARAKRAFWRTLRDLRRVLAGR